VDQFEAEIESLVGLPGKKKKGKSDADARSEECQAWVEKHREHIQRLETLLRMLDNDQVRIEA
jgi:CCR4-NOT transcriptional regulation complex NOT5 subunit